MSSWLPTALRACAGNRNKVPKTLSLLDAAGFMG
jgi:hypothetical protein